MPSEGGCGRIEIALPDGTLIRVPEAVGAVALRRVLTALRR
jgi:transposase